MITKDLAFRNERIAAFGEVDADLSQLLTCTDLAGTSSPLTNAATSRSSLHPSLSFLDVEVAFLIDEDGNIFSRVKSHAEA